MKYLICLAALLLAGTAFAGPIRDRIAARWESRPGVIFPHRGGSCGQTATRARPATVTDACPGGVCPVQPASPARVVRYTTVCEGGRCVLVPVRE